jgi:hypothetical protein
MAFYDQVHATRKYRLLTRKRDIAGNEYIYLTGVASTAAGSWVAYDELGITQLLDQDVADSVIGPVAVAKAAVDATTEFGWYQIFGKATAVAATVADGAKVFPSTTAGSADDTGTAGAQIVGAKWRSADSGGTATVQLNYPFTGVNVA